MIRLKLLKIIYWKTSFQCFKSSYITIYKNLTVLLSFLHNETCDIHPHSLSIHWKDLTSLESTFNRWKWYIKGVTLSIHYFKLSLIQEGKGTCWMQFGQHWCMEYATCWGRTWSWWGGPEQERSVWWLELCNQFRKNGIFIHSRKRGINCNNVPLAKPSKILGMQSKDHS